MWQRGGNLGMTSYWCLGLPTRGNLVANYQNMNGVPWANTQPHLARNTLQPLNGQGIWVPLSMPNIGVAGVGDRGISQTNADHYLQYQLQAAVGIGGQTMNLYQGKSIDDARRGNFSMPGTPHH